mmetsp:Transcript_35798/g.76456  ORF Transcript_35798/g.76456 Transcript_35798/m.76456 type:complete len:272 (+) Transcript_35798:139-954(+)
MASWSSVTFSKSTSLAASRSPALVIVASEKILSLSGTSIAFKSIPYAARLRRLAASSLSFFLRRFCSRTFLRRSCWISDWTCSSSASESISPPPSSPEPEAIESPSSAAAAAAALRSDRIFSRHISRPLKSALFRTLRSLRHIFTSPVVRRCSRYDRQLHCGSLVLGASLQTGQKNASPVQSLSICIGSLSLPPSRNAAAEPILRMLASRLDMSYPFLDRTLFPNSLWKMFTLAAFSPVWDLSPPPAACPSTCSKTHFGSNMRGSILSGAM